jgi:ketosteroid isomerase-like protein
MAHGNETLIRAVYDDILSGSLDMVGNLLSDDITWQVTGSSPVSGTYSGRQEVFGFFATVMELYGGTFRIQLRSVLANDDYCVVLAEESGVVDGESLEFSSVHLWSLRNGKCTTFMSYEDDSYHQFWSRAERLIA